MRSIRDHSIDLICCDLPYGTTRNKWDSALPLDELWREYKRLIRNNGVIVLFSQMPFSARLVASNYEMFKYEWIWEKEQGTGFLNCSHAPLKKHENILIFSNGSAGSSSCVNGITFNPQMLAGKAYTTKQGGAGSNYGRQKETLTINNGTRNPVDIIKFCRDKSRLHPTQKPVKLLEYIIKTYTNEGDTVLDNCMGSGTCGVACKNLNRNFIGIEKDTNYFNIAKQRMED